MRKLNKARSAGSGFTLLEVLAACALLMLVTGMAMEIFSTGLTYSRRSQGRLVAESLGKEKLENSLAAFAAPGPPAIEDYGSISGFSGFRRVTTVTDFDPDGTYGGTLTMVNVTVFWDNGRENRSFITLKADCSVDGGP